MPTRLLPALVLTLAACVTHAAPPPLPDKAMGEDVIGVLWIDAVQLDTAKLNASIRAMFGPYANEITQGLAEWERRHASFVRAGCTSMAIVQFDPYSINTVAKGAAHPGFLFSVKNRTDVPGGEALILEATRDERGRAQCKTEMLDDWIMAYDLRLAAPFMEKGSAERIDLFKSALDPIRNHPAALAFVPNDRMRRIYRDRAGLDPDHSRELVAFNKVLLSAKYLSVAATLGDKPAIDMVVEMPNTQAAASLLELQPAVIKAFAPIAEMASPRGIKIERIQEACNYHAVLANNLFFRKGSQINASIEGKPLLDTATSLAAGVIKAREEALIVRSHNQMQVLIVALNKYAQDHQGVYPVQLEQLAENQYVNNLKELLLNPRTGEAMGYVYIRPTATLQTLVRERRTSQTPMLYEARGGRIDRNGMVAFVNGAVARPDVRE